MKVTPKMIYTGEQLAKRYMEDGRPLSHMVEDIFISMWMDRDKEASPRIREYQEEEINNAPI